MPQSNSESRGIPIPLIHGMIDANAYHSSRVTWPLKLSYVQKNGESKSLKEVVNENFYGANQGNTTIQMGNILVNLNTKVYNEGEQDKKDVPSLIAATTMDMEFAHIDGYDGKMIPRDKGRPFQGWEIQIKDTETAAAANPLRFFPLFSYDPRRYRLSGSNDREKGWWAWDEPFSRVVGSDKKEELQIWLGFCMNPPLGFRPFDELCEHLPKFYEKCEKENIPILANCVPGGITTHDAKYYKYKRKELLEKDELSNDTSMYRGTENVIEDNCLNHFYLNQGHPRNWIPVLEHCPDLHLCLAGFGGNGEWQQADRTNKDAPLPTREWIRCIIKLTAKYKNVYADLSGLNIYDKNIRNGLMTMLDLMQNDEIDGFKHLKYKLIFGSGWYLTHLIDMSKSTEALSQSYGDYCSEFRDLFYAADKEGTGKLWERVSLINPWNFYALSEEKVNKLHDELTNAAGNRGIDSDLLKKMKGVFDGYDDVEGLVKYVSRYNEKDPPTEPQKIEDKDLAALDVEVLESSVVETNQIKNVYCSYGEEHNKLTNKEENVSMSIHSLDLNLHVETQEGNDGKTVEITIKNDGQEIELSGIVSNNNVVFEKIFMDKYAR